jgi:hypothetical protein
VKIFTRFRLFYSGFSKKSAKKASTLIHISQALGMESVTDIALANFDESDEIRDQYSAINRPCDLIE